MSKDSKSIRGNSIIRMNAKVDQFLGTEKKWRDEMAKLREIALDCGLVEEFKWGKPCYALEGKNVVLIVPFKDCCALLLTKGALLSDAHGLLIKPGEQTQAARQIRFTSVGEITKQESILKACINEAIKVERSGAEVAYKKITEYAVPEELKRKLKESPALKTAFHALTPGRQRRYLMYFADAKQAKTREARIEKYVPQILEGRGFDD